VQVPAESSIAIAPAAERLWTARIVHTALEEGLAKMDMAIATYGRREPLSLFCYGEPGTGKTTLAELFMTAIVAPSGLAAFCTCCCRVPHRPPRSSRSCWTSSAIRSLHAVRSPTACAAAERCSFASACAC